MSWLGRLETKALTIHTLDGTGFWPVDHGMHGVPRGLAPYARDVGSGMHSNVIMSPIRWIMRNFTEAEAVVEVRRNRLWERSEDHPLELLLAQPNPFYADDLLWQATCLSYCIDGNAYWQKVRNVFGDVLGYWYLPHFLVEPQWPRPARQGDPFISHYRYTPVQGGEPIDLPVRDVVHYRFGLDPENPRLGLSGVKTLLREVFTDEEAANFSAAILRNMGVPGGVIAPKSGDHLPDPDDVQEMKERMKANFTGQRRGEWMVLGTPTEIHQFGFDPQALMLGNLRDIAEERVCAIFGIPAAVVGFGAGLQQTKVGATMKELRREAWDSCMRPMQNTIGKQGSRQLIPDFNTQTRRFRLRFDTTAYAASQEEETEKAERFALLAREGLIRVDRAQEALGLDVDPARRVYLKDPPSGQPSGAPENNGEVEDEEIAAIAARVGVRATNGRAPAEKE